MHSIPIIPILKYTKHFKGKPSIIIPTQKHKLAVIYILIIICFITIIMSWKIDSSRVSIHKGQIRINQKDGAVMVRVPSGLFIMGNDNGYEDNDKPEHKVYLNGYWIYKYPVTVKQFHTFCKSTGRIMPKKPKWGWKDNHPIVNVSWDDANAYANWAGVKLPTEAQWEKAARGNNGLLYPWGNDWNPNKCQCSKRVNGDARSTTAIGSYITGASPYGCLDMIGNVYQWCTDWYDPNYYRHSPNINPQGPSKSPLSLQLHVIRGSSWYYKSTPFSYERAGGDTTPKDDQTSFRCVAP